MNDLMNEGALKSCCAGLYELPLTRLLLGSSFHPGGLVLTERLAQAASLGPGDRVLDIASGRGDTALHLAQKYGANVVALDLSESQVAGTNQRAKEAGLAHRVEAVRGDAEKLPFDDGSFDVVFCECALCTFPDRLTALAEVRRVLERRGMLVLSDVVLNQSVPQELQTVVGHVLCISGALSVEGYQSLLEDAGFPRVRTRDASDSLERLIDQIEGRIDRLDTEQDKASAQDGKANTEANAEDELLEGISMTELQTTLQAARSFVRQKGMGYATFAARAPS